LNHRFAAALAVLLVVSLSAQHVQDVFGGSFTDVVVSVKTVLTTEDILRNDYARTRTRQQHQADSSGRATTSLVQASRSAWCCSVRRKPDGNRT